MPQPGTWPPTEVRFVSGAERPDLGLPSMRKSPLQHRFAVIQETYRDNWIDGMYLDQPLWKAMVDFISQTEPGAAISMSGGFNPGAKPFVTPETFWAEWNGLEDEDRDPAAVVKAERDGAIVLYMLTEFWTQAGGPSPYHDSYTYSVFADRDLGPEIMAHLRRANAGGQWDLATEPMTAVENYGARVSPARKRILEWAFYGLVALAAFLYLYFRGR